jgi:beta-glucosidase/6-phospho-beta-glucosidase/beta-galactosidase
VLLSTIDHGRTRCDQLLECGHYTHWKKGLHLVKGLALKVLRYGLPHHKVHRAEGRYDLSFADDVMNENKPLGIVPILDRLHFGVPDWIGTRIRSRRGTSRTTPRWSRSAIRRCASIRRSNCIG